MSNFAQIFKSLREEKELTQEKLAQILGTTKQSISNYENGRRQPDFETLELIADFFNVDIDFLVGRSNIRNKYILDSLGKLIGLNTTPDAIESKKLIEPEPGGVIAAHFDGDMTDEELEEIENFIRFVKSKR